VKKLSDADAMLNSGKDLSAVLQSLGIAEVTFHRRSNEFGRNEIELSQTAEGT